MVVKFTLACPTLSSLITKLVKRMDARADWNDTTTSEYKPSTELGYAIYFSNTIIVTLLITLSNFLMWY
jgi:hypothetical protein